jgi:predicted DNA binding CopG/RHH family protein
MKRDPNMPIGKLTRVKDFLPPPSELIFPNDTVKVTIYLSLHSVEFFKRQARRNKTKYQTMVREVLDQYASHYTRPISTWRKR